MLAYFGAIFLQISERLPVRSCPKENPPQPDEEVVHPAHRGVQETRGHRRSCRLQQGEKS